MGACMNGDHDRELRRSRRKKKKKDEDDEEEEEIEELIAIGII